MKIRIQDYNFKTVKMNMEFFLHLCEYIFGHFFSLVCVIARLCLCA